METRRLAPAMQRSLAAIEGDLALGLLRLDDAVAELAGAGRADELASLLVRRGAPVAEADVAVILSAVDERCAAMLCGVMGLSVNGYSSVLRMRRLRGVRAGDPAVLLTTYRDLAKAGPGELAERLREVVAAANGA